MLNWACWTNLIKYESELNWIKYSIKAEIIWANLSWAELVSFNNRNLMSKVLCATREVYFYISWAVSVRLFPISKAKNHYFSFFKCWEAAHASWICPQWRSRCKTRPRSGASSIPKSPKSGLWGHGCSLHLQNQDTTANILNMGQQKTSDHISIKIKISNPRKEPPASSVAPN